MRTSQEEESDAGRGRLIHTVERLAPWAGGWGGPGFQEGLGQDARQEGAGSFWKGSLDRPGQQPRASPRRAAALPVRAGESAALPGTCRGGGGGQEAAPQQASGGGHEQQEERAGSAGRTWAPDAPRPPRPGSHTSCPGDVARGPGSGTLGQRTHCCVGRSLGAHKAGPHIRDSALSA